MTGSSYTFVKFQIVEQSPGYVYITSPDIPGFSLWGPPEQVRALIVPTIKRLYKLGQGIDVEVEPATDPKKFPTPLADEIPVGCVLALAA